MRKIVFTSLCIVIYLFATSQNNVGIGTITPNLNAVLDLSSNNKGFLAPRMTTSERLAISTTLSDAALMVYDTDLNRYLYWDGIQWVEFPGNDTDSDPTNEYNTSLTFDSNGNILTITDAGTSFSTSIAVNVNDADSDSTNEYNTNFVFDVNTNILTITDAGGSYTADLNGGLGNDWKLTGNAGTNVSTNYVGTSDNAGLSIRTNATERIRITANTGFVGIGTVPSYPLDVLNQVRLTRANASITTVNESQLELFNGSAGDVYISFHKAGVWGAHFGLDATNWFSTQGWSSGAGFTNLRTGSLQVNGTIQVTGGGPQAGFILRSNDAAGNASWVDPATLPSSNVSYVNLPSGSFVGLCVRNTNDGCCNCNRRLVAPITGWGTCPAGFSFEQISARWNGLNESWAYTCIKN